MQSQLWKFIAQCLIEFNYFDDLYWLFWIHDIYHHSEWTELHKNFNARKTLQNGILNYNKKKRTKWRTRTLRLTGLIKKLTGNSTVFDIVACNVGHEKGICSWSTNWYIRMSTIIRMNEYWNILELFKRFQVHTNSNNEDTVLLYLWWIWQPPKHGCLDVIERECHFYHYVCTAHTECSR